jgi:hypothetical protein
MIKMKKLVRSLVVALGGVFIGATASDAAGISFFINGPLEYYPGQFDQDSISDIEIAPGRLIPFFLYTDTSVTLPNPGINQVFIDYSVIIDDPAEIEFSSNPELPDLSNLGNPTLSNLGNPTLNFRLNFPLNYNRNERVPSFWIKTLDGMRNDGMSDLSFRLNSAQFINNSGVFQDISNLFGGAGVQATLEFQAPASPSQDVPEPGTMLSAAVALGWGAWLKRKNASQ